MLVEEHQPCAYYTRKTRSMRMTRYAGQIFAAVSQLDFPDAPGASGEGHTWRYGDAVVRIDKHVTTHLDRRDTIDVGIHLCPASGEHRESVFLVRSSDAGTDVTAPCLLEVYLFTPGPRCQHLTTLVQRAATVLNARDVTPRCGGLRAAARVSATRGMERYQG
jgi:hypothetical protein